MGSPEGLHNRAVRPPRGYGGGVLTNRSAPDARVAPVLIVADVRAAVAWYAEVLGFVEHVRIGEGHRAQLGLPDDPAAELVVAEERPGRRVPDPDRRSHQVMLKVDDADAVLARALARGAAPMTAISSTTSAAANARMARALELRTRSLLRVEVGLEVLGGLEPERLREHHRREGLL